MPSMPGVSAVRTPPPALPVAPIPTVIVPTVAVFLRFRFKSRLPRRRHVRRYFRLHALHLQTQRAFHLENLAALVSRNQSRSHALLARAACPAHAMNEI